MNFRKFNGNFNFVKMKPNAEARKQILEIVENQLRQNNPPETKTTLERLIESGYDKGDAKILIGQYVAVEIFNILKKKTPFDNARYVKNLNYLPKDPTE